MLKYKIWDKKETIYTIGCDPVTKRSEFTAAEMLEQNSWAKNPNAKVIITAGVINGMVFMEFSQTRDIYKDRGAKITDEMTDDEVLRAIETFEALPPTHEPSAEERIASAIEFQNLMSI